MNENKIMLITVTVNTFYIHAFLMSYIFIIQGKQYNY